QVTQAVEALLGDAESSDLVLLHFSCHGIKDDSGELFLAATNTVPNRLVSTAVDAALVSRLIQRSRAQRVVLLLDCCYGGAFERGVVARATGDVDVGAQFSQSSPGGGRGRVVITASSAMEYAFEGTTLTDSSGPTPSLFTGALVEGITSGEADRDQDGQVGLHELYDYVHDKVRARTPNQTPSKWEFGVQGDLFIARNPRRKILPARLPDELLEMVAHPTASVRLAAVQDLDQLAGGPNLRLAAGARLALQGLRGDDSRRVSAAATNALERTALRITPTHVDLGEVPIGSRPRVEIRIDGGPLALASSIDLTHEHFQARFDGSVLTIAADTSRPGPLDGTVTLSGPAGDATVGVTGTVVGTPTASQAARIREWDGERLVYDLDPSGSDLPKPALQQGDAPDSQPEFTRDRLDQEAPERPPAPDPAEITTWNRKPRVWLLAAAAILAVIMGVIVFSVISTRNEPNNASGSQNLPRSANPLSDAVLLWAGANRNGGSDIWRMDTTSKLPEILVNGATSAIEPAISPDRRTIAYIQLDENIGTVHLAAADGSSDQDLFPPGNLPCLSIGRMAWSPDGTMLAVACFGEDRSRQGLRIVSVDGQEIARLQTDSYAGGPSWSSLGVVAYWDNPDLPRYAHTVGGPLFLMSVRSGQDQSITTSKPQQLTSDNLDAQPAWSPDGTELAFQRLSNTSGWDIWLLKMDGGTLKQLTNGPGDELDPAWSPDGSHIVYANTNNASKDLNLWIMDVNGDNNQMLRARTGNDANVSWYR
ncbi:MAG: caspase family protein, partial [Actinomycetota bacterium]|nr:caspase family protein [Actinomycetota bacterium]